ncbi:MAG: isocitrate/isopropylmalate family dehydrogenase [candidate division WOR-3 bacterium]
MKTYRIAVIPGDGTGPEVVREGLKVLDAVQSKFGFKCETVEYDVGGDRYLKTGEILPDSVLEELKTFEAIYLGAIGHPEVKPGILEKGILLNFQESINTYKGVERCIRFAFEYAKKRNKRKQVTLCGKTNVLTFAFDLWERTFYKVAKNFPDIKTDYAHVDATCMWMVKNPEWFDVIVTDNMFGDIITDLGAMVQGGMGIAAGGNLNPEGVSMFEPIGGSAPKYTGKNVINPLAAICALSLMLDTLGEEDAAESVENSVKTIVKEKLESLSAGKMGYSTSEVGDLVVEKLA